MEQSTNDMLTGSDVSGAHSRIDDSVELHEGKGMNAAGLFAAKSVGKSSSSKPEGFGPAALQPPPNGGRVAWTQCADTFCLWFAAWGLVNSFGTRPWGCHLKTIR